MRAEALTMLPQNTESAFSRLGTGRLLPLFGMLILLGSHAFFLWSGTLGYVLTKILFLPAILLLCIGLFRNQTAVQKSDRKERPDRYSMMLVLSLLVSGGFLLSPLPNYIKDFGIQHRIQTISDEARLQAWGEQILQTPLEKLPVKQQYGDVYYLDDRRFPDYIRRIPMGNFHDYSYRLVDAGSQGRYLEIAVWHNRPELWGVLLCTPSYDPTRLLDRWLRRWKSGMYGWQERNPNS